MKKQDKDEKQMNLLQEKSQNNGFEDFSDCEILEYMLSFMFKQEDASEMAEKILDECGSLAYTFSEDNMILHTNDEFVKIADYMNALGALAREYTERLMFGKVFDVSTREAQQYIMNMFEDFRREHLYAVLLDHENNFIGSEKIYDGGLENIREDIGSILKYLWRLRVEKVVLAHNTLDDTLEPSMPDWGKIYFLTGSISLMDISVAEYFRVTKKGCARILNRSKKKKKRSRRR